MHVIIIVNGPVIRVCKGNWIGHLHKSCELNEEIYCQKNRIQKIWDES